MTVTAREPWRPAGDRVDHRGAYREDAPALLEGRCEGDLPGCPPEESAGGSGAQQGGGGGAAHQAVLRPHRGH
eukprot:3472384-Pyramimonas_sp.AAC.1